MDTIAITSKQMSEVDRRAVEDYGIEISQLMENAARSVADFVRSEIFSLEGKKIVCLAGKGNNGGDAIALARHLHNGGADVTVVLANAASDTNALSQKQIAIVEKMGVRIHEYSSNSAETVYPLFHDSDLLVDGLLGYNVDGDPRGAFAELINLVNDTNENILSYDVPSGMNPDTGEAHSPTVRAKWTVTLALPKVGLMKDAAKENMGELWLADISIPNGLYIEMGIEVSSVFSNSSVVRL